MSDQELVKYRGEIHWHDGRTNPIEVYEYYKAKDVAWLVTDAALRAQIDQSMRIQETLAKNVNEGLLKIRDLRARVEALQQALASIEKDAKQMREASYE